MGSSSISSPSLVMSFIAEGEALKRLTVERKIVGRSLCGDARRALP